MMILQDLTCTVYDVGFVGETLGKQTHSGNFSCFPNITH